MGTCATRADAATLDAIGASEVPHRLHPLARIAVINPAPTAAVGLIVMISAGTADLPVLEEAAVVAETLAIASTAVRLRRRRTSPAGPASRSPARGQRHRELR